MSIQVKEIAFVFHAVKDIPAARKFYEGLLGLKIGQQAEFSPGQWWIEYDLAGQALCISNAFPGQPSSSVALDVADLDAARDAAQNAVLALPGEIMEFPPCRMFQIKDPDGNEVMLHQRKAKNDGKESV